MTSPPFRWMPCRAARVNPWWLSRPRRGSEDGSTNARPPGPPRLLPAPWRDPRAARAGVDPRLESAGHPGVGAGRLVVAVDRAGDVALGLLQAAEPPIEICLLRRDRDGLAPLVQSLTALALRLQRIGPVRQHAGVPGVELRRLLERGGGVGEFLLLRERDAEIDVAFDEGLIQRDRLLETGHRVGIVLAVERVEPEQVPRHGRFRIDVGRLLRLGTRVLVFARAMQHHAQLAVGGGEVGLDLDGLLERRRRLVEPVERVQDDAEIEKRLRTARLLLPRLPPGL